MRNASPSYDAVRDAIAADLDACSTKTPASVHQLVGDLHTAIQAVLDRGLGFPDVAKVFERHGVSASPDAVRVAMRRQRKARTKATSEHAKVATAAPALPESHATGQTELAPVDPPPDPPAPPAAERLPAIARRLE